MQSNADLASLFSTIADILDIRGANVFRVRAYRNAARTIEGLSEPIHELVARDAAALDQLPGIGKGLHDKILEYCARGTVGEYDELKASVPPGLLELLNIPTLGPKRVKLLHDIGVDSVVALEEAATAGRVRDLPGMGEKTEAKLLHALREYKTLHTARMPWSRAQGILAGYLAHLRRVPGVQELEAAGSYRRGRDTVGDLDILVTTHGDARPIIEAFVQYAAVADILARGDTKASVILRDKIQADLRVVDTASFGAALQYFTGAKEHNVAIRARAKDRGLKVSEYGVFRGETRIAGATEDEVYAALDLAWIPPELREQRGEIEAAAAGTLPTLVARTDIKGDLHVHTSFSDGNASIAAMAKAAKARGYAYLAITDHSKSVTVAHGLDEPAVLRQLNELERARAEVPGIRILSGIEVDVLRDGTLDLADEVLAQMDYVMATVHYHLELDAATMTRRIVRALAHPAVRCLAHPTGRRAGLRGPYALDFTAVLEAARARRVMLEINAAPERLDLDDSHAEQARRAGVPLVLNTDAHAAAHFAYIDNGLNIARRAWCRAADIANTWPVAKLLTWKTSAT
jgi:DNA polymerase (family 10)